MAVISNQKASEFARRVEKLYEKVAEWLPAIEPSARVTRDQEIEIVEEPKPYHVPLFDVIVKPGTVVHFVPRGYDVLGAEGRVDVHGPLGTEILVYFEKPHYFVSTIQIGDEEPSTSKVSISQEDIRGWAWSIQEMGARNPALDEKTFRELWKAVAE